MSGQQHSIPLPTCALVVFGASGDLARRKIVPALFALWIEKRLPRNLQVVGFARTPFTPDEFRDSLHSGVLEHGRIKPPDRSTWEHFAAHLHYCPGRYDALEYYSVLRDLLVHLDERFTLSGNRLFYLAVPPSEFEPIIQNLAHSGLLTPHADRPWARVIVEKPFGRDLESARSLNRLMVETVDERHIFRIDHYMAKETVQNIMALRFANSIFEPIWNRKYIDHVQVTAAEDIGIEGRGRFYEQTGVLRDVVQSHLLEILALVTLEPPVVNDPDNFRDKKVEALRSIRILSPAEVPTHAVPGQYRGYRSEPHVAPDSRMATFAAIKFYIDNWRWQGVPFYLRAGKRLRTRLTEVAIHFQPIPLCLFCRDEACAAIRPNTLTLRIQPDEGISLGFMAKTPGETLAMRPVSMDFLYRTQFDRPPMEAYERALLDCLRGDQTLLWRSDGVEIAWKVVSPILERWEAADLDVPLYEPGTDGPDAAQDLLRRDSRSWRPLTLPNASPRA